MAIRVPSRRFRRTSDQLSSQRPPAVAAAVACLAMAGYLAINQRDQGNVRAASDLATAGGYERALAKARKVVRAPASTRSLEIRAYAAQALGRHRAATGLFRRAARRNPRSWSLHRDWAISLLALGERREARAQMDLASTLNPRIQPPPGF